LARQLHDYQGLAQALGVPLPAGFHPQSLATVPVLGGIIQQELKPAKKVKMIFHKGGKEIMRMVPEDQVGEVQKGMEAQGYEMGEVPKISMSKEAGNGKIYHTTVPYGSKRYEQLKARGWKEGSETAGWKPTTVRKPTPAEALRRISNIRKAAALLGRTDRVTALMVAMDPDLKGFLGQKLDPKYKEELLNAWKNEIEYLSQFIPEKYRPKVPEAGVQHGSKYFIFTRDRKLVPASESEVK